jgi:hypothetical protein
MITITIVTAVVLALFAGAKATEKIIKNKFPVGEFNRKEK